ncbi:hypothetical protein [Rhizobium sp. LC145]|uniref:hypothetical protein n=1 Tax=Rhizobium sp. LC145 TaxID=1120688 RepID=UPI001FDA5DA9|nr:hypothetical protein [Rhizobium sp. LC145]
MRSAISAAASFTEGEEQDFVWFADAAFDEIGGLCHDDTGLAGTGAGKNERCVLVCHDGKALLRRQRVLLDRVEKALHVGKVGIDEALDGGVARFVGMFLEGADNFNELLLIL